MKILPFIVLSLTLLSSYVSHAFFTTPQSGVAIAQDVEASNKTSQEKNSASLTLKLQKEATIGGYYVNVFVGTPNNTSPQYQFPMLMSLNSAHTSLFTNDCNEEGDVVGKCSTKIPFIPSNSETFKSDPGDNIVKSQTNPPKVLGYTGTDVMGFSQETKVSTNVVLRVNATMEEKWTGLISLSPNKNSFLQVLKNNSQITEQEFMYVINPNSGDFEMRFGGITKGLSNDIPWFGISDSKWQIDANYLLIGGNNTQECNGISRGAYTFFNESTKILLPQSAYDILYAKLKPNKNETLSDFNCTPSALEDYLNISFYTSQYRIDIPPVVYLDFTQMKDGHCPLMVDVLKSTKSCITLGYSYFGYNQVVFSKDKQQIGLLKKDNLVPLKVIPLDKYWSPIGLGLLVVMFGVVFVRSSQKEEEIRIDIDNAPRQVRSESYYEFSCE